MLIFKIIESGILDSSIKKIGGVPIYSNNKPVLKKDYVDSYNHYVYVLDNFIHYFYDNFNYNIDSGYEIIAACLKNNSDILLCNKYVFEENMIKLLLVIFIIIFVLLRKNLMNILRISL